MAVEVYRPPATRVRRGLAYASPLMARARTLTRSWFYPVRGPFTSVVLTVNGTSTAEMAVSTQTALAVGAVYAALGIYADLIGTLPVRRYRGEWERMRLPPFVERPAGAPVGWTDEIGQTIWSLLLRGNAYLIPTTYDATEYPETFWVADPDAMTLDQARNGGLQYRYYQGNGIPPLVWSDPAPDELLHLRWQRPPGAVLGVGVLDAQGAAGGTLAGAYFTERFAADVMSNPTPPALLTHPLRLNATQAGDLQNQWADSVGRSRAVPAVLSGGITYQPLNVTARDVQLIESRKWNAGAIATLFRLPPYMLGGSTGDALTYSTVEGENTRLWTNALQPMCVRLERAIGGAWTPSGQRLRFVPDSILRSQTLDRYNAHKVGIDAGFETVDEARELENRAPLPRVAPSTLPEAPAPEVAPDDVMTPGDGGNP
jgi:HK97 family phage portal protein